MTRLRVLCAFVFAVAVTSAYHAAAQGSASPQPTTSSGWRARVVKVAVVSQANSYASRLTAPPPGRAWLQVTAEIKAPQQGASVEFQRLAILDPAGGRYQCKAIAGVKQDKTPPMFLLLADAVSPQDSGIMFVSLDNKGWSYLFKDEKPVGSGYLDDAGNFLVAVLAPQQVEFHHKGSTPLVLLFEVPAQASGLKFQVADGSPVAVDVPRGGPK